jgi:hypothetical protein
VWISKYKKIIIRSSELSINNQSTIHQQQYTINNTTVCNSISRHRECVQIRASFHSNR